METTETSTSQEILSVLESIESYLEIISPLLSTLLIITLIFLGAYLFRITVLGKNQRNLW